MTLYLNGKEALESPYILGTVVLNGGILRPAGDYSTAIVVQNADGARNIITVDTVLSQTHLNSNGNGAETQIDWGGVTKWAEGMDVGGSDYVCAYHFKTSTSSTDAGYGPSGDIIRVAENWAVSIGLTTPAASPAQLAVVNHNDYDTRPVLLVQGGDGQSGNLLTIQDSAPNAKFTITSGGACFIHDTANAKNVRGLTVNILDSDLEAISIKAGSKVAHGFTGTESDTFGKLSKADVDAGGLSIVGYSETGLGVAIQAAATTEDATRSTAGRAHLEFYAWTKAGDGSAADPAADKNIMAFRSGTTTRFILDSDGDSHQDVGTAWTNFDDYDDVALLRQLSVEVSRPDDPIRREFGSFLSQNRGVLEAARLVDFNDDGHHFVNMSRLSMLLVGAVRQLGSRLQIAEQMLEALPSPMNG